jgi:hypothetical protein
MSALEKVSYKFVQYAKSCIRQNTEAALRDMRIPLNPAQWDQLAPIISASIDEAYAHAFPELDSLMRSPDSIDPETFDIPDGLIEFAGKMTSQAKRKTAAFTIVRNESFFLELWCRYYAREFGASNLYILDNSTSDGSVERIKVRWPDINIVLVPSVEAMRWAWCTSIVRCFQKICLKGYDVVVFSDADEYLVPDDGHGLRAYVERFRNSDLSYVRATGWGVVQQLDTEGSITSHEQVLTDRRKAWRTRAYDKTLISKVPLDWAKGSHTIRINGAKMTGDPCDPTLSLVHLRDLDVAMFHERCLKLAALNPAGLPLAHHGSIDLRQIEEYFRTLKAPWNPLAIHYEGSPVDVPETWRASI